MQREDSLPDVKEDSQTLNRNDAVSMLALDAPPSLSAWEQRSSVGVGIGFSTAEIQDPAPNAVNAEALALLEEMARETEALRALLAAATAANNGGSAAAVTAAVETPSVVPAAAADNDDDESEDSGGSPFPTLSSAGSAALERARARTEPKVRKAREESILRQKLNEQEAATAAAEAALEMERAARAAAEAKLNALLAASGESMEKLQEEAKKLSVS